MTPLSHTIRAADYPPHTRVVDVVALLARQGMALRSTRMGLIAIRRRSQGVPPRAA